MNPSPDMLAVYHYEIDHLRREIKHLERLLASAESELATAKRAADDLAADNLELSRHLHGH